MGSKGRRREWRLRDRDRWEGNDTVLRKDLNVIDSKSTNI